MKTKKYTVTIGLPAYNEEKNIGKLIENIYKQNQNTFEIEKVLVVSDGSTDNTNAIVTKLKKFYPTIDLQISNNRSGKVQTVNNMFQLNTSDFLVLFDADIQLAHKDVIENLVQTFHETNADLVGGVDKPTRPKSFFEKITYTWVTIWDTAKVDKRNGSQMYRLSARIMALRNSFAKKAQIPSTVVVDDQYLYLRAVQDKKIIAFSNKANVYYKIPSTLKDYLIQSCRYVILNDNISSHFNKKMKKHYIISKAAKSEAIKKSLRESPFFTVLSLALQVLVRISMYWIVEDHKNGTWIMVNSTK